MTVFRSFLIYRSVHVEKLFPLLSPCLSVFFPREVQEKINVTLESANASLTYKVKKFWYFEPERSNGTLGDIVTSVNVPMIVSEICEKRFPSAPVQKRFFKGRGEQDEGQPVGPLDDLVGLRDHRQRPFRAEKREPTSLRRIRRRTFGHGLHVRADWGRSHGQVRMVLQRKHKKVLQNTWIDFDG